MSLTGIRDLTLLNTPPAERLPILTYVGEYDDRAVAEAIRRELLREGQVFFVHNRVQDIEKVAAELKALVPEARVAVAHGQMDESSLEKVVYDFWEGAYDVLVCTTIIESGIDMPTVNTLVVDRADRLGLGQLHQLRGRVGRGAAASWCYLLSGGATPDSEARLEALARTTDGFELAEVDLELRGEGTILGTRQKGVSDLKLASLRRHRKTIELARSVAFDLVDDDPGLARHPALAEEVRDLVDEEDREYLFKN
jgi:transcription-repair coupling factor (superfamily II helicase)